MQGLAVIKLTHMKKKIFKEWLANIDERLSSYEYCTIPFATLIHTRQIRKRILTDFEAMQTMIDINDDAYKKLSSLGFKENTGGLDFRAYKDRGLICPNVMDTTTVEVDASVWMNEQLQPIQKVFAMFDLHDVTEITANYDQQHDAVLFIMQSNFKTLLDDCQRFVLPNIIMSGLWIAVIVLSTILFI
jgi:hypothetical protein